VGESVAIPHAKIPGLSSLVAAFGRSKKGVPFDAIDGQPVRLVFVLLVPENSAGTHLKALARIARLLKSAGFRDRLLNLPDGPAIYNAFLEEDAKY
jgi:PTS system nitrogen regulatory IIA component